MSRIHELSERRQRQWAQRWDQWERDYEARINAKTRLLEEEFIEKRRRRTESQSSRGADAGRGGL